MQLADRWLGIGSVVLALGVAGALAVGICPRGHHRHARHHLELSRINCSGAAAVIAPPQTIDVGHITFDAPIVDPYLAGLAALDVSECFGSTPRVDMLIEIAADGHVVAASNRPDKPTRASRCIAKQVRQLAFPASPSRMSIRYAFTR